MTTKNVEPKNPFDHLLPHPEPAHPPYILRIKKRIRNAIRALDAKNQDPSTANVSCETGLHPLTLHQAVAELRRPPSLDDESQADLLISPSPEDDHIEDEVKAALILALNQLSPRRKEVVMYRFGLIDGIVRTKKEVAEAMGVSESYVATQLERSLWQLRHFDTNNDNILEELDRIYKQTD